MAPEIGRFFVQYRMIALDLDGTLLNRRKQITPRTRAALHSARERGIITVIATGRTVQSAHQWSQAAGGGPVICCNGAGIFGPDGDLLAVRKVAQEPLVRALEICRDRSIMAECYTTEGIVLDRPFQQMRAFWSWVRPAMSASRAASSLVHAWWLNRIRPVRSLVNWASHPNRPPVLKLMVIGRYSELDDLTAQLLQEAPGLEITSSGYGNLEITGRGVTKASGLEQLGARLQIPREAMVAFGDSANDLDMLKYVGVGVAMGNATDQIKAAADQIAADCDEEGVAQVIERILRDQQAVHP